MSSVHGVVLLDSAYQQDMNLPEILPGRQEGPVPLAATTFCAFPHIPHPLQFPPAQWSALLSQ